MPFSSKAKEAGMDSEKFAAPPPSYEQAQNGPVDLDAAFANLHVSDQPGKPDPDRLLAHLKLLHAFQTLKEDVGYTDGLFGIWDSRAGPPIAIPKTEKPNMNDLPPAVREQQSVLSQVREKRWALYVARAADRYETWWAGLPSDPPLVELDMEDPESPAYAKFPEAGSAPYWTPAMLPPLGM